MTTESLQELKQRLLRDESVQEMIRARAYEIYYMRGVQPGGPAQDWFQAESEVLAFLLAHYPEQPAEKEGERIAAAVITQEPPEPASPKKRKPRAASNSTTGSATRSMSKKTAAKKAVTKRSKSKKASVTKPKSKRPAKESKLEDKTT